MRGLADEFVKWMHRVIEWLRTMKLFSALLRMASLDWSEKGEGRENPVNSRLNSIRCKIELVSNEHENSPQLSKREREGESAWEVCMAVDLRERFSRIVLHSGSYCDCSSISSSSRRLQLRECSYGGYKNTAMELDCSYYSYAEQLETFRQLVAIQNSQPFSESSQPFRHSGKLLEIGLNLKLLNRPVCLPSDRR